MLKTCRIKRLSISFSVIINMILLLAGHQLLWAHPADEFSYQDWTLVPDQNGIEVSVSLHCGDKLTIRLLEEVEAKAGEILSKEKVFQIWSTLFSNSPPLKVCAGDLQAYLSNSSISLEKEALQSVGNEVSLASKRKLFDWICTSPVSAFHLFRYSKYSGFEILEPIIDPNQISARFFEDRNKNQRFVISNSYRFLWPKSRPLSAGLTVTVDSKLLSISSGSAFTFKGKALNSFRFNPPMASMKYLDPMVSPLNENTDLPKVRRVILFTPYDSKAP